MVNTKKVFVILFILAIAVMGNFMGQGVYKIFAQTTLTCSPQTQTANVGQAATFTATGGTGSYNWYAQELTLPTANIPSLTITYPTPGTKTITVISGLQTASCTLVVTGTATTTPPPAALSCSPASQHITAGSPATLVAAGGPGGFTWYAPGGTLSSATASTVSVTYSTPGTQTISVLSGNQSASCTLIVDPVSGTSGTGNLTCTPASQTANVGQSVTFTASGGSGSYTWSAPELTLNNPTGSGFTVNYLTSGVKTISVTSAGQTANCQLTVLASGGTTGGNLACSPASQVTLVGRPATFTATGGTGAYTWSAPGLQLINPVGSGFTVNYATPGLQTISVKSGTQTATCALNVLTAAVGGDSNGLPSTGEGGARFYKSFLKLLNLSE